MINMTIHPSIQFLEHRGRYYINEFNSLQNEPCCLWILQNLAMAWAYFRTLVMMIKFFISEKEKHFDQKN